MSKTRTLSSAQSTRSGWRGSIIESLLSFEARSEPSRGSSSTRRQLHRGAAFAPNTRRSQKRNQGGNGNQSVHLRNRGQIGADRDRQNVVGHGQDRVIIELPE